MDDENRLLVTFNQAGVDLSVKIAFILLRQTHGVL